MNNSKTIIDIENFEKLKKYLQTNPRIIIITHAGPDGDAIGSSLGLWAGLKNFGTNVDVACIDGVPEFLSFVPFSKQMKNNFNENDYDAVWFTDCGNKKMTKFQETNPHILSEKMVKINLDHHPSNDFWGEINFVKPSVASSTELVFYLFKKLNISITPQIATLLLLGIYTDTGAFMHQNTKPNSYHIASELIKLGANQSQIAKQVFRSNEFKILKLWGKVLQNLHVTPDGAAIVGVHRKEYESIGAKREDLAGVIDYINSMPEAKYSVLLSEDEKGNVKASLRTRKADVDVKALAEKFGGGGHIKAAGFSIPDGRLEKEIKWKIVQD